MKTQMHRRFLAMLMTLVMIVSIVGMIPLQVSAAAPTSYTDLGLFTSQSVSINSSGTSKYFRFIPSTSGSYTFSSTGSVDSYGILLNSSGSQLVYDDDSGTDRNFSISYNLTAGTTYYLQAKMYSTNTGSYSVKVLPNFLTSILAGDTKSVTISTAGMNVYYKFIPTVGGSYTFQSTGSYDTYGYILDSNGNQLRYDDDSGDGTNFSMTYSFTAGTTYYLRTRMYSSSTTGTYSISLSNIPGGTPGGNITNALDTAAGTHAYTLFNSGATSSDGYRYSSDSNVNASSLTNGGYDIYATTSVDSIRTVNLGLPFTVNSDVTEIAILTIRAFDVDESQGERDLIYLVDETAGTQVQLSGYLSGRDWEWNTTTFRIDPSLFAVGHTYRFKLYESVDGWVVYVRNVEIQLTTDGGLDPSEPTEPEEPVILDHSFVASISDSGLVSTTLYLKTSEEVTYSLEYAATSDGDQYGSALNQSVTADASGVSKEVSFQLESGAPEGNYQIDVILRDAGNTVIATYTVTTSGPENSTVNYDANGGSNNLPVDYNVYHSGDTVTVKFDYVPSKSGYVFLGWATSRSATQPEYTENGINTFTIGADDVTLYAVWDEEVIEPIPTEPVDADVWDGTASSGFGGGTGTQSNPYLIYTAEQLAYLAQSTNAGNDYSGKYFKLMNNLDLNNREWTPIGRGQYTSETYTTYYTFRGNFDGNYHSIHNMKISSTATSFTGLFGCLYGASIMNLGIVDADIRGNGCGINYRCTAGILAGASATNCTISRVYTTGNVNISAGDSFVDISGLIGDYYNTVVSDCYVIANINVITTDNGHVGGLFGYDDQTTNTYRSYFYGTVSFTGGYTPGALSSQSGEGTYTNCYYHANRSHSHSTSVTLTQLATQSTFTGFNFNTTWEMGDDYPVLRGFGVAGPHVHSYTATVVPATCAAEGYTQYTCSCGDTYQDNITDRLPHTPGAWIVDQPATCTQAGRKHTSCTECGHVLDNIYEPALGHNYTAVITKAPTCTQPGINTYTCSRCGHSYNEYIYSEHNYSITAQQAPTCETDGYTTYTCANCGDTYQEIIPGEHDYVAEITKIATAESDGEVTYTCSICGDYYVEVIPARPDAKVLLVQDRLPWDENNNVSLLNKMVEDGYLVGWDMTTTANLSVANLAGYGVVLIANDQTTATYNQLGAAQEALLQFANAGGVVIYGACDHGWAGGDIGYTLPEGVTKDNYYSYHNYIVDASHPIVTGTYTDGKALNNTLLQGTYCSHTAFFNLPADANVILQDGHGDPTLVEYGYGDGHIILSGLTWEFYYVRGFNGNTTYTKNVYDDLVFYALQLSDSCDHAFDAGEVIAPTCEEKGYTLHTCAVCGITMKDNFVDAIGHTPGTWVTVREATQTATGLKELRCTVCNQLLDQEILPMINAPVVSVIAQTDPVIIGQTFEVFVVVQDCDDVLSAAFVPEYNSDVFELISVQWQKEAVIQTIDPEIMSAWNGLTDINGTLLKLVFKANALTSGSQITTRALVQDNAGLISLSVVGDTVAVIACPHAQFEISCIDSNYHGCVCTVCGYTELLAHSYDNTCDTTCNDCDYTREITHQGGEYRHDGTNHWQVCTVCGADLTAEAHAFDNGCDTTCNICDYTRQVTHVAGSVTYDDDYHWRNCTVCGEHLNVEAHFYYNSCDRDCNLCGRRRYATHTPGENWECDETEHWKICTVCGDVVETHEHVYDNNEDRLCNDCGYSRVLRGDVNGDGVVNSNDAVYLLYHTYFAEDYILNQSGDMNGDGDINSNDAIYLLSYTFFPDEYPLYYPEGN